MKKWIFCLATFLRVLAVIFSSIALAFFCSISLFFIGLWYGASFTEMMGLFATLGSWLAALATAAGVWIAYQAKGEWVGRYEMETTSEEIRRFRQAYFEWEDKARIVFLYIVPLPSYPLEDPFDGSEEPIAALPDYAASSFLNAKNAVKEEKKAWAKLDTAYMGLQSLKYMELKTPYLGAQELHADLSAFIQTYQQCLDFPPKDQVTPRLRFRSLLKRKATECLKFLKKNAPNEGIGYSNLPFYVELKSITQQLYEHKTPLEEKIKPR